MSGTSPSPEQALLIEFATRWARYGGGSAEDIYVEFGLSETDYFTRLAKALRVDGHGLDRLTALVIGSIISDRLTGGTAAVESGR